MKLLRIKSKSIKQSQYVRYSWMVEVTGIPTLKNENVADHINRLSDIAKIDNFMQEQIDIAHRTSKKADAPIIFLFNKKKYRKNIRQHRKLKNITATSF